MKIILKNSSMIFASTRVIPAGTELVTSDVFSATGYYTQKNTVGETAKFSSTEGTSWGSEWTTRFIPVKAGVRYQFKSEKSVANSIHALIDTDKKLQQRWVISIYDDFKNYTEFTPAKDGYMCVQSEAPSTSISVQNIEDTTVVQDWGTELP